MHLTNDAPHEQMEKAMNTTAQLIQFIEAHGIQAKEMADGRIKAMSHSYSKTLGANSEWETVEPTAKAVRNWLGY